jgi:uncharacterized damage-inducible protein DinB
MDLETLTAQVLASWQRHEAIMQYLLAEIPAAGLAAVPAGSRGRDVARQFAHLVRVREGWLIYHTTGKRPRVPNPARERRPTRAMLAKALRRSGQRVARFLEQALRGDAEPHLFNGEIVRWMAYLISHESHHRGQIMLALKQADVRIPASVKLEGVWGRWIYQA